MTEEPREDAQPEEQTDEQSVDELEQKLLDAMKALNRKNKMVEEYLDNLAQSAEKPAPCPQPENGSSSTPRT